MSGLLESIPWVSDAHTHSLCESCRLRPSSSHSLFYPGFSLLPRWGLWSGRLGQQVVGEEPSPTPGLSLPVGSSPLYSRHSSVQESLKPQSATLSSVHIRWIFLTLAGSTFQAVGASVSPFLPPCIRWQLPSSPHAGAVPRLPMPHVFFGTAFKLPDRVYFTSKAVSCLCFVQCLNIRIGARGACLFCVLNEHLQNDAQSCWGMGAEQTPLFRPYCSINLWFHCAVSQRGQGISVRCFWNSRTPLVSSCRCTCAISLLRRSECLETMF